MAIIPKFFLNSVCSIGLPSTSLSPKWIGSGFFVYRKMNDNGDLIPFFVTNRHVLVGTSHIIIRMKEKDSNQLRTINILCSDEKHSSVSFHPNPKIDIAIIPLSGQLILENNLEFSAFDIDEHAMESTELRHEGVDEGTLIYMLGFPLGLVNINSSSPICRLGCIARIDSAQIQESGNILVDIQNFPGNSGSPVITRPELVSVGGSKSLDRATLLGIVHSYIPYRESLINSQTQEVVEIRSENSGLANVHPVEYIREVIDLLLPIKSSLK